MEIHGELRDAKTSATGAQLETDKRSSCISQVDEFLALPGVDAVLSDPHPSFAPRGLSNRNGDESNGQRAAKAP